jgi:hypothetical protein
VASKYEPTRELLIKRTFLDDSAPNEREENILQYVIHHIYDDGRRAGEGACVPRARVV